MAICSTSQGDAVCKG
ncbi:MAG: hypothetical protein KDK22_11660, partial [Rhodobacteraceae bacterium]|nr:hypothetical protein [Paracoccaceae bacterium]